MGVTDTGHARECQADLDDRVAAPWPTWHDHVQSRGRIEDTRWQWAKLLQEEYPSEGYFMNTKSRDRLKGYSQEADDVAELEASAAEQQPEDWLNLKSQRHKRGKLLSHLVA